MVDNKTIEPIEIGKKLVRDENGRFVNGHADCGAGRPAGTKNFSTLFENAIKKLGDSEKIDVDSAEARLLIRAFKEAEKGNFNFYKDIIDRIYGKPKDIVDVESGSLVEFIAKLSKKNG